MRATILLAVAPMLLAGCLSKNAPVETRYFNPRFAQAPAGTSRTAVVPVRLWPVTAAPYLRDLIVWRLSDEEVAFDEINHWAASPDTMAEDALRRYLILQNGFLRVDSANAAALQVHVSAFEVDRSASEVIVELEATLIDPAADSVKHGVFTARKAAGIDDMRSVSQAAGGALHDAVAQVGEWLGQPHGNAAPK